MIVAELVYQKAGYIHLYRYRDGAEFVSPSFVESITANITKNTQSVPDGNSDFDEVFASGMAGSVTINMNAFEPSFWAAALSADVIEESSTTMMEIEEVYVPEKAPYTVTLAATPDAGTERVLYLNNKPFTRVPDAPTTAGEYSIQDNTITFSPEDAGTVVRVIYETTVESATRIEMPEKSRNDVFRVTVVGEAALKANPAVVTRDNLVIDRAIVSGDVNPPPRQREVAGHSVTFNVIKPRPGQKPVYYKVVTE